MNYHLDGDRFDSKDDHEFMHSFTCRAQLRYLMANAYNHQILQLVLKNLNSFPNSNSSFKKITTKYRKLEHQNSRNSDYHRFGGENGILANQ